MEPERKIIIDELLASGLVDTCVKYRLNKGANEYLREEMRASIWEWLLTYNLEKLKNAWENKHLSALITRFILNQFFSKTSPFFKAYKKFDVLSDEITYKELSIPDPSTL